MDTTVPDIFFNEKGECNFCAIHDNMEKKYPVGQKGQDELNKIIFNIKKSEKRKKYDCIVGISGGTDSTYTLYKAVKFGLRPLAVHFDNGWNSKEAVLNVKNTCRILGVELYTYVVNWEEFKDLQIAFLRASTPDAEIPTDVGIHATLIKIAAKFRLKYVLNGHSFRNEGMSPLGWTYMDGRYIKDVQKKFGNLSLKTFPNFTIADTLYYNLLRGIKVIPFLNYIHYIKKDAKKILKNKVKWIDYGGHHHESVYTKFFQSYLLPKKFNIDKRKTEYSAMILSGQITRQEALSLISKEYPFEKETVDYVINKLGLDKNDFSNIMNAPIKNFKDYKTYYSLIIKFEPLIKLAIKIGLLPHVLYYKFFGHAL